MQKMHVYSTLGTTTELQNATTAVFENDRSELDHYFIPRIQSCNKNIDIDITFSCIIFNGSVAQGCVAMDFACAI